MIPWFIKASSTNISLGASDVNRYKCGNKNKMFIMLNIFSLNCIWLNSIISSNSFFFAKLCEAYFESKCKFYANNTYAIFSPNFCFDI